MKRDLLNNALSDIRTTSTMICGNLQQLGNGTEELNKRINQFVIDCFKSFDSKCKSCACPDCHRESKIMSLGMHEGLKLSVLECEHYIERQV